jgi:hypothetical protein
MNKKIPALFIAAVLCIGSVVAQVSVDPADRFYTEATSWEIKGLVPPLPQLRPYPLNVVRSILKTVIDSGSIRDAAVARQEYERIFSKPYTVELEGAIAIKESENRDTDEKTRTRQLAGEPAVAGDIQFHPLVSIGYRLGIFGTNTDESNVLPYYTNTAHDAVQDPSTIGPFKAYLDMNSVIAVGTENIYATAGVSRVGFGPFLGQGIALNETSYHAANMTFVVNRERWSFSQLYESIGATTNTGDDLSGNKFLALHSFRYQVSPKLAASYYETVVFGRRAEPSYLFPSPYMVTQGINGCNDNLQMGLLLEYKPFNSLKWTTDIFVDDVGFNELVKLNLDTKMRIAAQTGLQFAPFNSPCTLMTAMYTVVLPYTYSHWEYDDVASTTISGSSYNYQNYTNNGVCMGASIPPDSDRVLFTAKFNPRKNIEFTVDSSFVRHQNVCESLSDDDAAEYVLADAGTYSTDGSVYTQSMFSGGEHVSSAWNHLLFMSGDHSMYVCSAGLSGQYTFPKSKIGQISLKMGYEFEYVHNAGVDATMYSGGSITANSDNTYQYNGTTYATKAAAAQAAVDDQKQAWIDALYDEVNHYFSVSMKIVY